MAQISRPFQIALGVVAVLGLVSVFALHRHSSSESSAPVASSPTATPSAPAPSSSGAGPGAPSKVYHGSAPGVTGLTRAVAKAHGAVGASEVGAKQAERQSAETPSTPTSTATSTNPQPAPVTAHPTARSTTPSHLAGRAKHTHGASPPAALVSREHSVEAALKQGRVAVVLFWSPAGADDLLVHREVQRLASNKGLAVYEAAPSQVASFGSITRGIQIYGTPSILIVTKTGKTTMLSGLTDTYSIEQAISELGHT